MHDVSILIPAYNPDGKLVHLVRDLARAGLTRIVVVDDGSTQASAGVFEQIAPHCRLLRHAVNLGKGRAIKNGLNFCLENYPESVGVVTVDADGQHRLADILRVAERLGARPDGLVIGCRRFSRDIPLRSYLGNIITRYVFLFFVGRLLADTQSGLRGIPRGLAREILTLDGERYEYETNMLLHVVRHRVPVEELPIETVYIDDNATSHFRPFFDSLIIYSLLLKFSFSSLTASIIDTVIFYLMNLYGFGLPQSVIAARAVSSIVNFTINRDFVFRSSVSFPVAIAKYYALVVFIGTLSYLSIDFLHRSLHMDLIAAKIASEVVLYLVSFLVQRDFIFTAGARRT